MPEEVKEGVPLGEEVEEGVPLGVLDEVLEEVVVEVLDKEEPPDEVPVGVSLPLGVWEGVGNITPTT